MFSSVHGADLFFLIIFSASLITTFLMVGPAQSGTKFCQYYDRKIMFMPIPNTFDSPR